MTSYNGQLPMHLDASLDELSPKTRWRRIYIRRYGYVAGSVIS